MNLLTFIRSARRCTKIFLALFILAIACLFLASGNTRPLLKPPIPSTIGSESCIDLRPERGPFQEAVVGEG